MKIQRKWKRCGAGHLLEVLMARIFAKKAGCLYLQGFSASGNKKLFPLPISGQPAEAAGRYALDLFEKLAVIAGAVKSAGISDLRNGLLRVG